MNKFWTLEKNQWFLFILVRWLWICFWILPSTSGSWDNPQGIFQKHWKCPYWVASERDHNVFYENQSIRGFFGFEFSFHNCFWNFYSIFGLSQICKKRNVCKLPSSFSRNTNPCSEKTSWNLKTAFWKKNCPINSITVFEFIEQFFIQNDVFKFQ
jgi:hypothetical protein